MSLPIDPPVRPMLARSVPDVPGQPSTGAGWVYEPKWDGFRVIIHRDGDDVVLGSRTGKPIERYFPEVVDAVRAELPERCVVDGELVIAIEGEGAGARLDFDTLSQRIHPADSRVRMLSEAVPAHVVVFDVLARDDDDLTARPLVDRLEELDALTLDGPRLHVTPRTSDAEVASEWFAAFEGAGLDGVMAKSADGAYEPNKRGWLKVKHARTADVVLAGMRPHKTSTPGRPLVGSLLLGLYDDVGALQLVGAASSFTAARRAALHAELSSLVVAPGSAEAEAHPWLAADGASGDRRPGAPSRWSSGKDSSFVALRPERVLEVGYDHMEGTRFRHTAQLKRWRPDREPASCTFDQLEEPVGYDLAALLPGAGRFPAPMSP
ncbi:ATP-dependent DNA ligase [Isoptericola croceus]|uniref:ATP-dependent DNA ligase n=1 Tax=Isoptericola croceus TaxID=3031406 RepID=UPI0023F7756A|nr:ATP-dependent DNA ligase [Isoptericola croceus]